MISPGMVSKKDIQSLLKAYFADQQNQLEEIAEKLFLKTGPPGSTWLNFEQRVRKAGQTTDRFDVLSKDTGYLIGKIKWSTIAKSYCFFPDANINLDATQLDDISAFIHTQMNEWRGSKKTT
jgi:hypothetical protein